MNFALGRAQVVATEPGPEADDDRETASVLLAQLGDEELEEVRERAAHINEVLIGFRSGSDELPEPGGPGRSTRPLCPSWSDTRRRRRSWV